MNTSEHYSPWSLLPSPEPATVDPPEGEFYQSVAKHLIKDTVRIMHNGLPINLERVSELEDSLDATLSTVHNTLMNNKYINQYMKERNAAIIEAYKDDRRSKLKSAKNFPVVFNHTKMDHRSYFMHVYGLEHNINQPLVLLPNGLISKWPVNLVKKLSTSNPVLRKLVAGELSTSHPTVVKACNLLSQHKADIFNRKHLADIADPPLDSLPEAFKLKPFNPGSSDQLRGLFAMLGEKSEKRTDKDQQSWNRDNIERVNKATSDPIMKELTQALIDYSFGAIIKQNFIPAFYKYTVDGRLHGQYVLFGAKSFRYTSKQPNMLNSPSTRSIYAKPVKRCFQAPKDHVIYAIDLSALEDRVIASLSCDKNKCALFTDGLDGHCLNALGYFREEVAKYMPLTGNTTTDARKFFELQENGHKELKAIRQRGKPVTFGLSYGAHPPKVASSIKCSLEQATQIFNSYHHELYPGITSYRENYVLPTAQAKGKLHLGLGCYIKTDRPDKDIRTLSNATCQFWSVVTALTINKTHQWIDDNNLQNDIKCTSTIYDSIYFTVRKDPALIKRLNDFLVPVMTKDFINGQIIHNEAVGELGNSWSEMTILSNGADLLEVKKVLAKLSEASD